MPGRRRSTLGRRRGCRRRARCCCRTSTLVPGRNYNDLDTDYKNNVFVSGQRDFYDYNYGVT